MNYGVKYKIRIWICKKLDVWKPSDIDDLKKLLQYLKENNMNYSIESDLK